MTHLDVRSVQGFLLIAEHLHFGRAAQELHIAQPSLSERIKRLEDQLGFALFKRSTAGVLLTPEGEAWRPSAEALIASMQGAESAALRIRNGGTARIVLGITHVGMLSGIPKALRRWRLDTGAAEIEIIDGVSNDLELKVDAGVVDLAIVHPPLVTSDLQCERLFDMPGGVALAADHALARLPEITLADLRYEPFIFVSRSVGPNIYDRLIAACASAGFSPVIAHHTPDSLVSLGLVAAGAGVAFVVKAVGQINHPGTVYRDLTDQSFGLPFALVWKKGHLERTAQALAFSLREN